jgi:hypothetical protein
MGGLADQLPPDHNIRLFHLHHNMAYGNRKERQILPLLSGLYIRNEAMAALAWSEMGA